MQMDRFTTLAQEVLAAAQSMATGRAHAELTPLHVLAAMLEDRQGIVGSILAKSGVQPERVRDVAEAELGRRPSVTGTQPRTAPATMEILQKAEAEAKRRQDAYVSTEHLLLAMFDVPSDAKETLGSCGADRNAVESAIDGIRSASGVSQINDPGAETNYEALKKYAIDLNERAAAGKIDPVIGRDEEIRRCMQVLSRRTKNNPVLIGEPGVGKTAIAEGLAIRIVDHDCPEGMRNARIMALDVGQLLAGAKFRGEFEERHEVRAPGSRPGEAGGIRIILFIDEIHTLVGAGKAEGAIRRRESCSSPRWPVVSCDCVGATTLDEYRQALREGCRPSNGDSRKSGDDR